MKNIIPFVVIPFLWACANDKSLDSTAMKNSLRKSASSTCLPDANPATLVDGCGNDPRFAYTPLVELYSGSAAMPIGHRQQGDAAGALVVPVNELGQPSPTGKIYVDAEGMSNALRVFDQFNILLAASGLDNSKVRFRNKSQGGIDLQEWVEQIGVGAVDPKVQIVFLHHSLSVNFSPCDSQTYADTTRYYFRERLLQLKVKYPNLKQVFTQSREFGGWKSYSAPGSLAEPAGYYNAFGVKQFVDLQVSGSDSLLSYSSAPFIAWSIYPWEPVSPRSWFEGAGLHPCPAYATMLAQQWFDFLLNDSTTRQWFAANP